MDESKSITINNQPGKNEQKRFWRSSIKHLHVTSKDRPVGLAIIKANRLALGIELSQYEAKKASEDSLAEEESKFLAEEAAGEGKTSDEGASSGNVV